MLLAAKVSVSMWAYKGFSILLFASKLFISVFSSVTDSFKNNMESYFSISPYCISTILDILSFIPKPVKSKAVQPDMPIRVMMILFLYLNKFLIVTFQENDILFQIKLIFSSNTLRPFLGLAGLSRLAGLFLNLTATAIYVTRAIVIIQTSIILIHIGIFA